VTGVQTCTLPISLTRSKNLPRTKVIVATITVEEAVNMPTARSEFKLENQFHNQERTQNTSASNANINKKPRATCFFVALFSIPDSFYTLTPSAGEAKVVRGARCFWLPLTRLVMFHLLSPNRALVLDLGILPSQCSCA